MTLFPDDVSNVATAIQLALAPVFLLTAREAGLSAKAADVMRSASTWSMRNAQMTWRIAVPMPRPWNLLPSQEPVSPVRKMR